MDNPFNRYLGAIGEEDLASKIQVAAALQKSLSVPGNCPWQCPSGAVRLLPEDIFLVFSGLSLAFSPDTGIIARPQGMVQFKTLTAPVAIMRPFFERYGDPARAHRNRLAVRLEKSTRWLLLNLVIVNKASRTQELPFAATVTFAVVEALFHGYPVVYDSRDDTFAPFDSLLEDAVAPDVVIASNCPEQHP